MKSFFKNIGTILIVFVSGVLIMSLSLQLQAYFTSEYYEYRSPFNWYTIEKEIKPTDKVGLYYIRTSITTAGDRYGLWSLGEERPLQILDSTCTAQFELAKRVLEQYKKDKKIIDTKTFCK